MHVLVTCNFEKGSGQYQSSKRGDIHFRYSRAANSVVSGGIWPKFELVQAFTYVLVTCEYGKEPIKTAEKTRIHSFSNYNSIFSDAQGQLTP